MRDVVPDLLEDVPQLFVKLSLQVSFLEAASWRLQDLLNNFGLRVWKAPRGPCHMFKGRRAR